MDSPVTILPFGDTVEVAPDEPVLAAILRQRRFVRHGCKHGGCGTCRAEVVAGDYRLDDRTSYALRDGDRAAGVVLLCSTTGSCPAADVDVLGHRRRCRPGRAGNKS